MEDDLKLQDFDQWVKIFILKHEGENLSKESKILGHPTDYDFKLIDAFKKHLGSETSCH